MEDILRSVTEFLSTYSEIIGAAASVLVLISFLFKNVRAIRTISIIGCIFFVAYGLLIGAWIIWVLNAVLILVHIYFLIRLGLASKKRKARGERRLGKFSREAFHKKGLRDLPWFVAGDLD